MKSCFAGDGRISFHPRTKSEDFTNVADVDFTVSAAIDFTVEHSFTICYPAFEVSMLEKGKLSDLSMDFAVSALKLCGSIKGHYSLVNQLVRSATSIGANIREANYAHSKPDFIAKLQIALKECYETEYWLELIIKAEIVGEDSVSALLHDGGSLRRMLISSINTAKTNLRS